MRQQNLGSLTTIIQALCQANYQGQCWMPANGVAYPAAVSQITSIYNADIAAAVSAQQAADATAQATAVAAAVAAQQATDAAAQVVAIQAATTPKDVAALTAITAPGATTVLPTNYLLYGGIAAAILVSIMIFGKKAA